MVVLKNASIAAVMLPAVISKNAALRMDGYRVS
jgi:hypothetical protein